MDSLEVINERVKNLSVGLADHIKDCGEQHKDLKADVIGLHKRLDKILEVVQGVVLIDQKVNTLSAHIQIVENTIKDFPTVKQNADHAKESLQWVSRIVLGVVISAILGLVIINK